MWTWKNHTMWFIMAFAMVGAAYDVLAIYDLNGAGLSIWGVLFSVGCAAAISSIAGSALFRYYQVSKAIFGPPAKARNAVDQTNAAPKAGGYQNGRRPASATKNALPQFQSFDFTICKSVKSGSQSYAIQQHRMTQIQLKHHLKCLLEHSVLA